MSGRKIQAWGAFLIAMLTVGSLTVFCITYQSSWRSSPNEAPKLFSTPTPANVPRAPPLNKVGRSVTDVPKMSASDSLRMAAAAYRAGDGPNALLWTHRGVERAQAELAALPALSGASASLGARLIQAAEPLRQDPDPSIQEELLLLDMHVPRDSDWDQRPEWGRINHMQAMMNLGRSSDALAEAASIRADIPANDHYTEEQLSQLDWLEAQASYQAGRIDAAKSLLQKVISESNAAHANDARKLLNQIETKEGKLPGSPTAALVADGVTDSGLLAWAKAWEAAQPDSRPNSAAELQSLAGALGRSHLSAAQRLSVGNLLNEAGDIATAELWYLSGIDSADREVADAKYQEPNGPVALIAERVVRPLLSGFDAAQSVFWAVPGPEGGLAEQKICDLEMPLPPQNDWDQRHEWIRIGRAEALYQQRLYLQALAEANAIANDANEPRSRFTNDEKMELHWARGLVLFSLSRYQQAASELQILASATPSQRHAEQAWPILINALCRLHHGTEAQAAFSEYSHRYPLDAIELATTSGAVQDAKYNEAWEKGHTGGDTTP
jgi:outer membrane protein assembly factor BamD (BamD/ComL family)